MQYSDIFSSEYFLSSATLLIVEDSPVTRQAMVSALSSTYAVYTAADGAEALQVSEAHSFDLILVDLGLPDIDGNKLWTRLRELPLQKKALMIVVSGRADIEDKLMSFSMGAADYLVKPVDPRELRARISAVLKRNGEANSPLGLFRKGPFTLHFATFTAHIEAEGKVLELDLTPQEFKALHYFLNGVSHVVSRQQVLDHVWGRSRFVQERSVDALMSKLRRKITGFGVSLEAVHGMGYRLSLVAENEELAAVDSKLSNCNDAIFNSARQFPADIFEIFKNESVDTLQSLHESIAKADTAQTKALAHRWKSACRLVGLDSMGALCLSIEKSDFSNWTEVKQILSILEAQFRRLNQGLAKNAS